MYTQKEAEMAAGMGNYVVKPPDASITDIEMRDKTDNVTRTKSN